MSTFYLRPETKVEPLCFGWYAYPHLVAPVQCAMNLAFRLRPMLESFIDDPALHQAASQDPALLGGPFINLGPEDVDYAKSLLARIKQDGAHLLKFATDYKALDRQLQKTAKGHSLDVFYKDLPDTLAGLLELVYDVNHYPIIRLYEELIYAGGLSTLASQELCLHQLPDTKREMFISTPQMDRSDRIIIRIPFADSRIDILGAMRLQGAPEEEVWSLLDPSSPQYGEHRERLSTFVTTEAPERKAPNYSGPGVRVRYFGHACLLVQAEGVSVLIDPLLAFERNKPSTLTINDLPDTIDYVVISHCHQDHLCPEMFLQLRSRIKQVIVPRNLKGSLVDPSLKLILRSLGCSQVTEVDPTDQISIPGGFILSLPFPGEQCGLDISGKHTIGVKLHGRKFLFLVDSEGLDPRLYDRLKNYISDVDMLFIGLECHGAPATWAYGPMMTRPLAPADDSSRRANGCDCERAMNIVNRIGCSQAYAYAMGMEPWTRYLLGLEYTADSVQIQESDAFVERCHNSGIISERLNGTREWLFESAAAASV